MTDCWAGVRAGAARIARPHGGIHGGLPGAPLRDGRGVQPVLGRKGADARATPEVRLEHAASFGAP
jgi:hypothetical protein